MSAARSGIGELRDALLAAARELNTSGLSVGRSGNLSLRTREGFLITPSGIAYDTLDAGELVHCDHDGNVIAGRLRPSSEWRIHRDIYAAKPAVAGIVHAHPTHAGTLACLRRGIPAFHYMVLAAGGNDIPCAGYATFGTEELSRVVLAALAERHACLMANHGIVATGASLSSAFELAQLVEQLAEQYLLTLAHGGPVLLSSAELDDVRKQFANAYGNRR